MEKLKLNLTIVSMVMLGAIFNKIMAVNESEPNNVWNQADVITLGVAANGTCAAGGEFDWWRVTTTQDGALNVNLTATNFLFTWASIYDTTGTPLFVENYTSTNIIVSWNGLAKGTYYIKIRAYYTSDAPTYSFVATTTPATGIMETEPNGSRAQALTLLQNDSLTGHIGFYYKNARDTTDWYKVTTTKDGQLDLTITNLESNFIWIKLYDNNGVTILANDYCSNGPNNFKTISRNDLAKGTYYISVYSYYSDGFSGYAIKSKFTQNPQTIDLEPNATKLQALTLNPTDSLTGHIGFFYNGVRDTTDWYKVTTTLDGQLDLKITTFLTNFIWVILYDNTGTTVLASNYCSNTSGSNITISRNDLAAATYYVRVYSYFSDGYSGYSLKSTFTPNTKLNDAEPNDVTTSAINYVTGSTVTGHIGFYKNGARDLIDYYKVNVTSSGKLDLTVTTHMVNYVWVKFYDVNGNSVLVQDYTNNTIGSSKTISYNNLAKGIYYIAVNSYYSSDYSSYTLNSVFQSAGGDDPEKNNFASKAKVVGGYSTQNGNVGYYSDATTDVIDWHKLDYFSNSGPLTVTITPVVHTFDANFASFNYKLYKDTNAAPIADVNFTGGIPNTYTYNTLTAGAHYIKIERLSGTFGEYKIQPNYKDTTSHTLTLTASSAGTNCSQGKLTYFITRGRAPYSCQLYKDNVAYGLPVVTNDSAFYSSLPVGNYQLKVKGNGATGYTVNSLAKVICPKPKNLVSSGVTASSAVISWFNFTCVDGYILSYKKTTDVVFTNDSLLAGATTKTLAGLTPSTTYNYKLRAYHKVGNTYYLGAYTAQKSFTTLVSSPPFFANNGNTTEETILMYPNPAVDVIKIESRGNWEKIEVYNSLSQLVATQIINGSDNEISQIDISDFQSGMYQIVMKSNHQTISKQFIKE
jgi:Secretion system C-terminal sorting domain/Bacterial pre-peptidase C-terminal domain/Fibronectin type III domain